MTFSRGWRWLVAMTRDSKPFFFAFAAACAVVPGGVGYCVMQLTNTGKPELEAKLRQSPRQDSLIVGDASKQMLAEFFGELQRKEDINDRYVAALRGEILTRKQYKKGETDPKTNDS